MTQCPNCQSAVRETDRFCPKCGRPLTALAPETTPTPVAPATYTGVADTGRVSYEKLPEVPIVETGQRYPGLVTLAHSCIVGASVLRVVGLGAGLLAFLACIILVPFPLDLILGLLVLLGGGVIGWYFWVSLTMRGEGIQLLLDFEETYRKKSSREQK